MIYEDTAEFLQAVAPGRGLAGLDLGTQTIGVAVSDTFLRGHSAGDHQTQKVFPGCGQVA